MLTAEYLIRDRNGRYYELTLGNQPPVYTSGQFCKFRHALQAETFISSLNFSLSQWLQIIYRLRMPLTQALTSHKEVVPIIASLLIEKRLFFYALPSVKHTSPVLSNEEGYCYSFILGPMPPPAQGNEMLQPIYGQMDVTDIFRKLRGGAHAILSVLRDNGFARKVHGANPDLARELLMELLIDQQILVYKLPYNPAPRKLGI